MGSSIPRANIKRSAPGTARCPDGEVIRCAVEVSVPAVLLMGAVPEHLPLDVIVSEGRVLAIEDGEPVAEARDAEVGERLRQCMGRGFRYTARLEASSDGGDSLRIEPVP